jgi:POT family proton-dependent oligopeptide transporter
MFKGHPKGLYVAFLTNMGERFGFYTMMGILVLFLQAKFNLSAGKAATYFSIFYFLIYALALVGGYIADRTQNYKGVVASGVVIMFVGYLLLAIPGLGLPMALLGLLTIAFGNGLFKGNLQAIVGQMYDNPEYSGLRDSAYSIFYMGINVGAMFAPNAAYAVQKWFMKTKGFVYDPDLPVLCNVFVSETLPKAKELAGTLPETVNLTTLSEITVTLPEVSTIGEAAGILPQTATVGELAVALPDASKLGDLATAILAKSTLSEHITTTASKLGDLAAKVSTETVTDLKVFAENYLDALSTGYHYAFGIAGIAMLISLTSYIIFKRHLPEKRKAEAGAAADVPQMSKEEEKKRLFALFCVFAVVIFFWMSFHQNGLTMTFFARDYTAKTVAPITGMLFNIWSLLSLGLTVAGLVLALKPSSTGKTRLMGGAMAVIFGAVSFYFYQSFSSSFPEGGKYINPVIFQHFNAFFVVFLTPVIVGLFAWLRSKSKEPSAPRKIGIGMIIAALGFVVLLAGSIGLPSPAELTPAGQFQPNPIEDSFRVSTQWLVNSYLVLTFAELFLSPMGLSFVSKVAPPRFQGLMQGGWLGATAIGNQLVLLGGIFWAKWPIWMVWSMFIACCLVSAAVMFSLLKRLEKVAK